MNSRRKMAAAMVRRFHAECDRSCDDPHCPYIHTDGWTVPGHEGVYDSYNDALDVALAALAEPSTTSLPEE